MKSNIPEIAAIKDDLQGLGHADMQELSKASGVPFTTLWKIRDGTTVNPGIETVRSFYPFMPTRIKADTTPA